MEKLIWHAGLATGREKIDDQHRHFIELINSLGEELQRSDDTEYQKHLLWELKKYADFHFQSEENIMYKEGVVDWDLHKIMHTHLSTELGRKIQSCIWGVDSPAKVVTFLIEWFLRHTLEEDAKSWATHRKTR